jgi:hypothetical protein
MSKAFFGLILLLLSAVAIGSCNLSPVPLDIEVNEPPQKLVISSYAIPEQSGLFTITRTFSALLGTDSIDLYDNSITSKVLVDNALAVIRYSNVVDTLFAVAPGIYATLHLQQIPNIEYRLEVFDPKTQETVYATTTLLPLTPLDTVFPVTRRLDQLNQTIFTFRYAFGDPVGIQNYYLVSYTNINTLLSQFSSTGNLFNFNQVQFNVFSDQNNGDGQPIQYQPDFGGSEGDTLVVALSNIPKGYYEYLAAYKRSGNLLSQLTGEPVNLPTNVQGGYGYFALTKPSIKTVILHE